MALPSKKDRVDEGIDELLSQDNSLDLTDEDCDRCGLPIDECVCDAPDDEPRENSWE